MAKPLMATIPFAADNLNDAARMQREMEEDGTIDKARGDFAQVVAHTDGQYYCVAHCGNIRAMIGDMISNGWL